MVIEDQERQRINAIVEGDMYLQDKCGHVAGRRCRIAQDVAERVTHARRVLGWLHAYMVDLASSGGEVDWSAVLRPEMIVAALGELGGPDLGEPGPGELGEPEPGEPGEHEPGEAGEPGETLKLNIWGDSVSQRIWEIIKFIRWRPNL